MPSHKTHCAISKKRTGYDFSELHNWIDGPSKTLGKNHRTVRHAWNDTDRKTIQEYWDNKKGTGWGDKAVIEWLFHISLDNLSTAFKWSKITYGENRFNFYKFGLAESGYLYIDFDNIADSDLKETFSEEDTIFDDNDESLFDIDLTSVVKDVKKIVKGFSKSWDDLFKGR
jgi:hypothetical protein